MADGIYVLKIQRGIIWINFECHKTHMPYLTNYGKSRKAIAVCSQFARVGAIWLMGRNWVPKP